MTQEQQNVFLIKGMIAKLPAAQREAVEELSEHIRRFCKSAGDPVATLAIALIGAEEQLKAAQSN